jgi:hypothetical protein
MFQTTRDISKIPLASQHVAEEDKMIPQVLRSNFINNNPQGL